MGFYDACIREYQKALGLKPGQQEFRGNLERALAIKAHIAPAIENAEVRLKSEPHNVELLISLGGLHLEAGNSSSALTYLERTLAIEPENKTALQYLAGLYTMQGGDLRALKILLQLSQMSPDQPQIHYNIACIYSKNREFTESIQWLERALDNGYGNWNLIESDPDLENLRATHEFQNLLKRKGTRAD